MSVKEYFEFTDTCRPDNNMLCIFWMGDLPVCGRLQDGYIHRETSDDTMTFMKYPESHVDYWIPCLTPTEATIQGDSLFRKKRATS